MKIMPKFMIWLIILGISLAWRTQNLDAFGLSNDEGAHLMWAKLTTNGFPLYEETRAVQSPLFLETIGVAFQLFGQTIQVGRWVILASFGLLLIASSYLAHRAGGWLAAISALVMLSLSPLIFTHSRLVMAEVPATALAVTSLALLLPFIETERRVWLLASGLLFGLSLITKTLYPFMVIPVALLILFVAPREGSFKIGFNILLWSVGLCLPFITLCFIYDPSLLYEQLILFRSQLRTAVPGSFEETADQFKIFISSHWGFFLLACGAVLWNIKPKVLDSGKETFHSFIWLTWLIAGMFMLAWHTPLFPHHFIVLIPPLVLLGSEMIGELGIKLSNLPFLLIVIVATFNIPAMIETNQQTAAIVTGGREAQAIEMLSAVTQPTDFVMGDSQLLIFMADRQTPPPLGDVALVAIKAGLQNSERMINLTKTYHAPAVVKWSLRLPWLPDYLDWVETNYLARRVWDNDHIIYFVPHIPASQAIPNQQTTRLGEAITLRGYQLISTGELSLKLYWQTNRPLTENYTVFNQLLDSSGQFVAGWDSQPLGGYFPTSEWPVDEIITDMVDIPLPVDLPVGEYTLITGMYRLDTMERLITSTGTDHVVLGLYQTQ